MNYPPAVGNWTADKPQLLRSRLSLASCSGGTCTTKPFPGDNEQWIEALDACPDMAGTQREHLKCGFRILIDNPDGYVATRGAHVFEGRSGFE